MSDLRPLAALATVLVLVTVAAGCIDVNQSGANAAHPVRRSGSPPSMMPPAHGNMTGDKVGEQTTSQLCTGSVSLPPQQTYCAKHTIWIKGAVDGLKDLPVSLSTFAGGVNVHGGPTDDWNLTVVLQASGDSDAAARANLANIDFRWSHVEGSGHHLKASAEKKEKNTNNRESAAFDLLIPRSLELFLNAQATSGGVTASDLKGSQIVLQSTSGGVTASRIDTVWFVLQSTSGGVSATDFTAQDVQAQSTSGGVTLKGSADQIVGTTTSGGVDADVKGINVELHATSGGVDASVTPAATGSITLQSTSGGVSLRVPEGAKYGYSVDARTSSGSADIALKDGSASGTAKEKHFATTNLSKREIRTTVSASTSSGSASVSPA